MSEGSRVLLAALKSGSGKTTITCGLIQALKNRGMKVSALKCGPDYIDPMFHRRVLGIDSGNLDTYFTPGDACRQLVKEHTEQADITIIEGVMGYYDGLGGLSTVGSSYEASKQTATPVILVADGKGSSVTLAAAIKGVIEFRPDSNIKGIILNRVSESYYDRIKSVIEKETGIDVLGFLPDKDELKVSSRHLGLVSPQELLSFDTWILNVSAAIAAHIDIERIIEIADGAKPLECKNTIKVPQFSKKVEIAVARDDAFSFYYKENLGLLRRMGAHITEFSPLTDASVPDNADVVLLGGGYPELYAGALSQNKSMLNSIRTAAKKGIKIIAECGGFMYLMDELEDINGDVYPMAGVIPGKAYNAGKLTRFGYAVLEVNGCRVSAHEFHRWDTTNNGEDATAVRNLTDERYSCMHVDKNTLAGFPHLYYYSGPDVIYNFIEEDMENGRRN